MNFVPCVTWIKQGVARRVPEKVSITKEELKLIIEENKQQLRSLEADEGSEEGSDSNPENDHDGHVSDEYDMDNYDEEDDSAVKPLAGLAGLTLYASNEEDPHMTIKDEDDEDDEDFEIHTDDNLIVVSHVEADCSELDVYVYNDAKNYLYVHHSIMLSSVALCTEWLNFDPAEETPANLIAVGNMTPVIEIWDVDVVDCLEPVFKLGESHTNKKTKRVKKNDSLGHTDAVLDLSWNKTIRNFLASASADNTVALWDMAEGTVVRSINQFTDKVQTLEWHPAEAQTLLAGSYDNTAKLFDCRIEDQTKKIWTLDGEVERVLWDHHNPFYFYASTDKGFVYAVDVRATDPVWTISAHSMACTGLTLSSKSAGCLMTASTDKTVKVWDIRTAPIFVSEKSMNMGELYCLQASPDSAFTICCGGDNRSKNFGVRDMSSVTTRFQAASTDSMNSEIPEAVNSPSTSAANFVSKLGKKNKPKHLKRKQQQQNELTKDLMK
uniref:Anaphase-promoting complex subunit 4-like WD40 domain-containing protein n=1 Tax=Strigamia maritima TaxID=126957 RepID=T1JH49_STRMM